MTMIQIRYFIEVARQKNFTKAAKKLFVVQQVVSKQVKALEEELGFPLFRRMPGRLCLTDGGEMLYVFWEKMLREQRDVIEDARQEMSEQLCSIRIGTLSISSIQDMIAEAIRRLSISNQSVSFHVECDSYRGLRKKLEERQLDCIVSLADENVGLSDEYEEKGFLKLKPALVIAENHPLYRPDMPIQAVSDTTIFILSQKFSKMAKRNILEYCHLLGIAAKHIQYFDDVGSMEMALSAGKGVAFIYPEFFRNTMHTLKMIPLVREEIVKSTQCSIAYRCNDRLRLEKFISELFLSRDALSR